MKSHLELARAVYRWIVRNAVFPRDGMWGQSVSAPLFPQHPNLEETLLYGVTGTWSERVAALFVAMAKACHLEAVMVSGYWRHDDSAPGEGMASHNHCWNAVKVNGLWRLVDCAAGARLGGHTAFFTLPEHFRLAYQPLNAPWSLLRDYISNEAFFAQPWARTCFFNHGCRVLSPATLAAVQQLPPAMQGLPLPAPVLRVAVAPGFRCGPDTCRARSFHARMLAGYLRAIGCTHVVLKRTGVAMEGHTSSTPLELRLTVVQAGAPPAGCAREAALPSGAAAVGAARQRVGLPSRSADFSGCGGWGDWHSYGGHARRSFELPGAPRGCGTAGPWQLHA